ncbi:class I SAM-dependent methyltransferase [Roseateles violae]|uniref:Methyltransferase domain-containing protein n=1 Tax=Roseateles violae TaxID=3058042 RepID=A0ABT8DWC2_9BURK|nr:methyltransferase domain-containing protein [Pelomonas sp. PFR6]MDN3920594.1 methyltransferase domain-containing protein [Pelomonas sp. PFR6]
MSASDQDRLFTGSIPQLYDEYMVPLIFEPYAADLAARVASRRPSKLLEIAAGTGVVTRQLARALAPEVGIVATDLNQAMLDRAIEVGTSRPVQWRQADATQLPFADQSFDLVVCQFGVMFFPDKPRAFSEARRVLRPGGAFVFNAWDRIEHNEFADAVTFALQQMFPSDPPRFMARVPHGYGDTTAIAEDLAAGGFVRPAMISTLAATSRAASPNIPAIAYCQGTLLRTEIETRAPSRLSEATAAAAAEIGRRFGQGAVEGKIQAHIVAVER